MQNTAENKSEVDVNTNKRFSLKSGKSDGGTDNITEPDKSKEVSKTDEGEKTSTPQYTPEAMEVLKAKGITFDDEGTAWLIPGRIKLEDAPKVFTETDAYKTKLEQSEAKMKSLITEAEEFLEVEQGTGRLKLKEEVTSKIAKNAGIAPTAETDEEINQRFEEAMEKDKFGTILKIANAVADKKVAAVLKELAPIKEEWLSKEQQKRFEAASKTFEGLGDYKADAIQFLQENPGLKNVKNIEEILMLAAIGKNVKEVATKSFEEGKTSAEKTTRTDTGLAGTQETNTSLTPVQQKVKEILDGLDGVDAHRFSLKKSK